MTEPCNRFAEDIPEVSAVSPNAAVNVKQLQLVAIITAFVAAYPDVSTLPAPILATIGDVPLVDTPLNITVMRLTPEGMLVKSMLVPDVDATAVPLTKIPTVPVIVGRVSVVVPATACSCSVQLPLVEPDKTRDIIFP